MKSGRNSRDRIVFSLALTALVGLLGLALRSSQWRPGENFLHASYDSLHALSGARENALVNSPAVILYLDLPSFLRLKLDPAQPWPRELHAQMLRRLKSVGARAVVFDVVFSREGPKPEADEALAAAVREHGRVILAAEYSDKSTVATDGIHERVRIGVAEPIYEPLSRAAAGVGVASLAIDRDRGVRRFVGGVADSTQPTLAWAAAAMLAAPATLSPASMHAASQRWVRYYGPPLSLPQVSYSQALEPGEIEDGFFRDKVVFIGSRQLVGSFNDKQDEFASPFDLAFTKELFMPGVEVQATEFLNVLREDWLRRLPQVGEALLLLVAAALGGALVWLRPIPAAVAALGVTGLALGLALVGFGAGIWFPWLIVSGAQIPIALGGSVLFSSAEWYRTRRRFEARLREQAALIDKAHDAIVVQDLAGMIVYANPSAEQLYGWPLAELQRDGTAPELFLPDESAAAHARVTALKVGEWNGELRQQTRDGRVVIVASRWTLIRNDAGQPTALLMMNSDITEQKQLEQQFLRTQRMNTIGTLAGGMAHDLNNALAPVLMGAQLLKRKTGDEEARQLLSLMETSTQRGADMVRQVLLFARGRGGELERLDAGALVRELEKLVRETFPKNITVEVFLPADLWAVQGNLTQLHQVLLNLCVNARDAMPDGGKLRFVVDNVDLDAAEAAAIPEGRPGDFVCLAVSDTGTGMPLEVRARIFDPFFTTKAEGHGTGIGLSTVLRLVKAHGGFLRVESEPGEGTTFEVFLPRAAKTAPAQAAPAEIPRGQGELILVVDDERAVRELVSEGLTLHGYRVLTAAGGEEAILLFRQHRAEIRLALTDSAMPGMDGAATIVGLQREKPGLPVILASAGADTECSAAKAAAAFLRKPFSLDELLLATNRVLMAQAPLVRLAPL